MRKVLLLLVFFIAFALRFFQLGVNPPSLTWDEAAWGYNAYSLGIDGKDEFGRFLPIDYLESFGDFKPPMYAYLDVIPVKVLGLTEFATRLPSAFFGFLTVVITYFLTKAIFFSSKQRDWFALGASFILAVSPWHIMLSRAAFEANVATFFLVTGLWLFLESMNRKKWLILLSAISFVFSMYTFNTSRVVAPLIVVALGVVYWRSLLKIKKQLFVVMIIGIIVFLPLFRFLLTPQAKLRFQEVNIFSDISVVQVSNQEIKNDHNAWWSKIIHNRRVLYAQSFLRHYFDNLNPNFLFIKGDGNPKFSTQDVGEMYLWDLPFFILGILFLFRRREGNWFLIPIWVILGIMPAATARETPHALRIETIIPTFQIITAYGLVVVLTAIIKVRNSYIRKGIYSVFIILLLFSAAYFLHGYYFHYPREYSGEWQYGYRESIKYVEKHQGQYDNVYVTKALGRPYIYYLFYLKIYPSDFRKESVVHRDAFGFVNVEQVGKYHFIDSVPSQNYKGRTLFINTPDSVPSSADVLERFDKLDGKTAIVAYTL